MSINVLNYSYILTELVSHLQIFGEFSWANKQCINVCSQNINGILLE